MRKIIHVDMDCFYASVEEKYRPELKGKPVGIGGPPNSRGVLCTANYEARKYKVRSAMPSSQAVRLCPHLILIPPHFALYRKESQAVRQIFQRYSDCIEPLSLDEAYLDVTGSAHCQGSATRIALEIRKSIQNELGLTASAGIAPNKFLAKVASDWKKPNGQFVIRPQDVEAFMIELPIEKIPGVGKVTAERMHKLGLKTCRDLQLQPLWQLESWFGSRGRELADFSRGVDDREVRSRSVRKSLTVEETYNQDVETLEDGLAKLRELYRDWEQRMLKSSRPEHIRGYVVKLKFFDFKTTTHEISKREWPAQRDFEELLTKAWLRRQAPVRLIGIGVRLEGDAPHKDSKQLSFTDLEV